MVVLLNIEMEVSSHLFLILSLLPIGISDRLPFILIGKVFPTRFATYEEKVIFSIFNF